MNNIYLNPQFRYEYRFTNPIKSGKYSGTGATCGRFEAHVVLIKSRKAYDAGQIAFGENKAQELIAKQPLLPADVRWHFIGHLQTNKVKYLAPFVSMIESVDSLKLLKEINKQAAKNKRVIDVLLQFHIAEEDTKFGLDLDEATALLASDMFRSFQQYQGMWGYGYGYLYRR